MTIRNLSVSRYAFSRIEELWWLEREAGKDRRGL
jgi:hypothetical protein